MTQINSAVHYAVEDGIGVIEINSPPVNALTVAVTEGLYDALDIAARDMSARAVVLICAGRTFIAGADIKNINNDAVKPRIDLAALQERLSAMGKPLIAAIHGTALGGGLEVAMCAHFRIAVPSARLGLPEVKIGLLPGAGGTQRLPRLTGAGVALDMMTTGDMIGAERGREIGRGEVDRSGDRWAEDRIRTHAQGAEPHDCDHRVRVAPVPDHRLRVLTTASSRVHTRPRHGSILASDLSPPVRCDLQPSLCASEHLPSLLLRF